MMADLDERLHLGSLWNYCLMDDRRKYCWLSDIACHHGSNKSVNMTHYWKPNWWVQWQVVVTEEDHENHGGQHQGVGRPLTVIPTVHHIQQNLLGSHHCREYWHLSVLPMTPRCHGSSVSLLFIKINKKRLLAQLIQATRSHKEINNSAYLGQTWRKRPYQPIVYKGDLTSTLLFMPKNDETLKRSQMNYIERVDSTA